MADPAGQDDVTLAKQRLGTKLCARWPLERLIGFGGMAAVYASRDEQGTPVAIKILHASFSTNEGVRQRFIREAQLTNAVEHEGRVAIYEEGVSENNEPYFVMELLEGMPLDRVWKKYDKKLPVEYALEIVDRVLDLLGACHALGIVHRDLKPANIFIGDNGVVKVLDFGVARKREAGVDPTMAGTALGTPAYMAPEQALGSVDRIDGRTDLFAVGAVMHTMLTGKRLHEGRSNEEAFVLAATRPAPSVAKVAPDLAPELVAIIDRALSWDPRNRFQTAAEMREAIAAALAKLRGTPEAPPEPQKPRGQAQLLTALAETADTGQQGVELSPEEQAKVGELQEIFTRIERGLNAVRQYGGTHKVALGHLETIHELISRYVAREPGGLSWDVKPHSFTLKGAVLWEPLHPFDEIPYNLFASGFRKFTITAGVTLGETVTLLELMRRDPIRDFSPEDDLATAFWEKQLEHVQYQVVGSFLTVGATDEADREYEELMDTGKEVIEAKPSAGSAARGGIDAEPLSLEERAAIIAARQAALRAVRSSAAASLDQRSRELIAAALDMPPSEWEARYVKVLAHAAADALEHGNLALVSEPLRVALHEAAAGEGMEKALERTVAVLTAVTHRSGPQTRAELARALLDTETFAVVLKALARPVPEHERESVARCAPLLEELMRDASVEHFDAVLAALVRADVGPVRDVLLRFLELNAAGREDRIGALLSDADLGKGRAILGLLARLGTEAAARALRAAESSAFPELRVEAIALRAQASTEGLREELSRLLSDPDPAVRMAVLETMARYKVKEAGPTLVQMIGETSFHKLSHDERRRALETLWELSPVRAESLLRDMVVKSGLITRDAVDDTRVLAIQLLERLSSSPEVISDLEKAARKWGNTQLVRDAAGRAAAAMRRRLGAR